MRTEKVKSENGKHSLPTQNRNPQVLATTGGLRIVYAVINNYIMKEMQAFYFNDILTLAKIILNFIEWGNRRIKLFS